MMKQIIALLMIGLMLNTSIVFAATYMDVGNSIQSTVDETYSSFKSTYDDYLQGKGKAIDLGEAIIVNVKGYEPAPIPQSAVENQEVPVRIYLTGTTFGSLATYVTGEAQPDLATGISNIPPIKDMDITLDEKSQKYLASYPKYIAPIQGKFSLDNLGQVIVVLKQFKATEKEVKVPKTTTKKETTPSSDFNLTGGQGLETNKSKKKAAKEVEEPTTEYELNIPESIDLNFSAKIYFDLEKGGLFDISQQNLILKIHKDERAWLDLPDSEKGRVFANRAYVRATKVTGSSAQFVVYDKDFHLLPALSGYLDPGARNTDLAANAIVTLGEGQESNPIRIGSTGDLFMDSFILRLNKIIEPQDKAEVKVSVNGQDYIRTLVEGSPIYPSSKWKVESIVSQGVKPFTKEGFFEYAKKQNLEVPSQDIPAVVYVRENLITIGNGYNSFTITNIQATIDPEGKRGIFSTRQLSSDEAGILESIYCAESDDPKIELSSACKAVDSFKEIVQKYPSNKLLPEAYYNLAEIYREHMIPPYGNEQRYTTDMNNLAYYYYNKVLEFETDKKSDAVQKLEELTQTFASTAFLDDEGVYLEVLRVIPVAQQDLGTAKIQIKSIGSGIVEDKKTGDTITNTDGNFEGKPFKWEVANVTLNSIKLVRTDNPARTEIIYVNTEKEIKTGNCKWVYPSQNAVYRDITRQVEECDKSIRIKLVSTDVPVELDISAIPGTGKAYSTANFKVHLLIDKRPFELSPDQLRAQIKKTEEMIKKLDAIITKLDKLVREWKKTCLVVSTYLMIKSSFLTGNSRNEARKTIMPIYNEQCKNELEAQGKYTTTESRFRSISGCYLAKSDEIEKSLDAAEKIVEEENKKFSEITKKDATGDEAEKYKKFIAGGGTDDEYKEYLRYSALAPLYQDNKIFTESLNRRLDTIGVDKKIKLFEDADEWARQQSKTGDEEEYKKNLNVALISFNNKVPKQQQPSTVLAAVNTKNIEDTDAKLSEYVTSGVLVREGGVGSALIVYTNGEKSTLNLVRPSAYYQKYYDYKVAGKCNTPETTTIENCLAINDASLKESVGIHQGGFENTIDRLKKEGALDPTGRPIYIINSPENIQRFGNGEKVETYSSTTQEFAEGLQIRKSYAQQNTGKTITAQYTLDGNAYCYPLGDLNVKVGDADVGAGEYALVLDWYKTNVPSAIEVWNVGPDGMINCGKGDDQLIASADALKENPRAREKIFAQVRVAKQCKKEGDKVGSIKAGGKTMIVSCSNQVAQINQQNAQPQCTDVMDPGDCKLLFNVCDPVMCPTSRCNLGGRWQVDNVMASGLIGSIVLCWPNKQDGVMVPVCLTGILAGLTNIKTILDGYKTCLTAALEKHENIGMCDYIRSVGICELAWKELMFIVGAKGGVIDWALGKLSPNRGGGEYLSFRQSFDQMSKSFNYFTTEYSESLLAQYKAKSTSEIGTEVCRMAVAGKFPNLGELLNEFSEPEEPPQFMAVFDESPSVTQSGVDKYGRASEGQSIYRGFYHIYSGKAYTGDMLKNAGLSDAIQYSVYLRSSRDSSLYPLYVTKVSGGHLGKTAVMKRGAYAQESINVYGASGYDQICVVIDGKTYCGYGKTSSAFSVGALQDQLVVDEALRANIKTAEECAPGHSVTSPSLGSLTMPQQFGMLNSGIVRICNPVSPGAEDRWMVIGDCGNDKNGKYLGRCWLDRNSISINDAKYAGIVAEGIEKISRNVTGYTGDLLTDDVAITSLNDLNKLRLEILKEIKETEPCKPSAKPTTLTTTPTTPTTPTGKTKCEEEAGSEIYGYIVEAAGEDIPVEFLCAIIKQESGFNSQVVRKQGEKGIMQFTLETWKEYYKKIFGSTNDDRLNARASIITGAAYLRDIRGSRYLDLDTQKDDFTLALMALGYNDGPSNAKKCLGYTNYNDFTRGTSNCYTPYVKNVMYYYNYYKQTIAATTPQSTAVTPTGTPEPTPTLTQMSAVTDISPLPQKIVQPIIPTNLKSNPSVVSLNTNSGEVKLKIGDTTYDVKAVPDTWQIDGQSYNFCHLFIGNTAYYRIDLPLRLMNCAQSIQAGIVNEDTAISYYKWIVPINPPKTITTQAIKDITGKATEDKAGSSAQATGETSKDCEDDETEWTIRFKGIKVTVNGQEREITYDEFIKLAISSDLIAQALFQKGEYYVVIAKRRAVEWKTIQFYSFKEIQSTTNIQATRDDKNLILKLDPKNLYEITIFSGSNFVSVNSIKDDALFSNGQFTISIDKLKENGIDPTKIDTINVKTYNTVVDLDNDRYEVMETISNIEYLAPKVSAPTVEQIQQTQINAISRTAEEVAKIMESVSKKSVVGRTCSADGGRFQEYANYIVWYSEDYEIPDPLLIVSLMMQESGCKNVECNSDGYCGLMQIKKGIWDTILFRDYTDPEVNIKNGIKTLREKYDGLNGNCKKFSSACNSKYKQITYCGWDAAIRGYNGWGCNENYPNQDYFVDEVMERYNQLKGNPPSQTTTQTTQQATSQTPSGTKVSTGPAITGDYYLLTFDPDYYYLLFKQTKSQPFKKSFSEEPVAVAGSNLAFISKAGPPEGIFIQEKIDRPDVEEGGLLLNGWLVVNTNKHKYEIIKNEEYGTYKSSEPELDYAVRGLLLISSSDPNYDLTNHCKKNSDKNYCGTPTTRTAVCIDNQNNIKLFASPKKSMTVYQLTSLLISKGCKDAVQFDSGGSTAIGYRDPTNKITIQSSGSDSSPRNLNTINLLIPAQGVKSPEYLTIDSGEETQEETQQQNTPNKEVVAGECSDCTGLFSLTCTKEKCEEWGKRIGKTCVFTTWPSWVDSCLTSVTCDCSEVKKVEATIQLINSDLYSKIKPTTIPTGMSFIDPKYFDNTVVCVPDATGEQSVCAQAFGFENQEGNIIKPCFIKSNAIQGIENAREEVKKILGEDYEILIMSSYRTPEYQRCLRTRNKCTTASVCGKVSGSCPKGWDEFTSSQIPSLKDYILSLKNTINVNTCPHVTAKAIDLCVYNTKTDSLTPIKNGKAFYWNDDWKDCTKNIGGTEYHACSCRYAGAITKYLLGTGSKPASLSSVPQTDLDQMRKEVQGLRKAMISAGWATTRDPNYEWWHYNWESNADVEDEL